MSTVIRTLPPKDAEILARSIDICTVFNGTVERHGLHWQSPALRDWELKQRVNHRSREVEVRFDELDLHEVYVDLPGDKQIILRAVSTRPLYTRGLSLFEHKKLKAALKEKQLVSRLERMSDEDLYRLRLEYHAALGRQGDRVALRQLEKLRDQLLARSLASTDDAAPNSGLSEPPMYPPPAEPLADPQRASAPAAESEGADRRPPRKRAPKRRPEKPATQKPPATRPPDDPPPLTDDAPSGSTATPSLRSADRRPTFPSSTAKRIPK